MSLRRIGLRARPKTSRKLRFVLPIVSLLWIGALTAVADPSSGDRDDSNGTDRSDDAEPTTAEVEAPTVPSRRPSPPPPIGVRFGEPLVGERFRVSYSFEHVHLQGLLRRDDGISPSEVFATSFLPYDRTPRSLDVTEHTIMLAYAPHPRVTLVLEVPILVKQLETQFETGQRTERQTQGLGDIGLMVVLPFIRKGNENSHVHLGLNVPSGNDRLRADGSRSPYDLQLGNGTVDFEWGWTYTGEMDWLSWGGQGIGYHPLGRNSQHYREGSRFDVSIWSGARLYQGLSLSLRLAWQKQNNISGNDRNFLPIATINDPSLNSKARGGSQLSVNPGLTLEVPRLANQRIALEIGIPFYQDVDGPQLQRDWSFKAGWQWGF